MATPSFSQSLSLFDASSLGPYFQLPYKNASDVKTLPSRLEWENDESILQTPWKKIILTMEKWSLPYYIMGIVSFSIGCQTYDGPSIQQWCEEMKKKGVKPRCPKTKKIIHKVHYYVLRLFNVDDNGFKQPLDIQNSCFEPIEHVFPNAIVNPLFLKSFLKLIALVNGHEENADDTEEKSIKQELESKVTSEIKSSKLIKYENLVSSHLCAFLLFFEKTPSKERIRWLLSCVNFKNLFAKGIANAQNNLGICYEEGQFCKINLYEAFRYYKLAAEQGDKDAQNNLANCFQRGIGCEINLKNAFTNFEFSAKQGLSNALYQLAYCYEYGKGCEINLEKAFLNYQLAAEKNHDEAQASLADFYRLGIGCEINLKQAFFYYDLAAKQELVEAQYELAKCYNYGYGCDKNLRNAIEYYRLSAGKGHLQSMYRLASIYDKHGHNEFDEIAAFRLYETLTEKEHLLSTCNLAYFYLTGTGCEKNSDIAHKYFNLLSINNFKPTSKRIRSRFEMLKNAFENSDKEKKGKKEKKEIKSEK